MIRCCLTPPIGLLRLGRRVGANANGLETLRMVMVLIFVLVLVTFLLLLFAAFFVVFVFVFLDAAAAAAFVPLSFEPGPVEFLAQHWPGLLVPVSLLESFAVTAPLRPPLPELVPVLVLVLRIGDVGVGVGSDTLAVVRLDAVEVDACACDAGFAWVWIWICNDVDGWRGVMARSCATDWMSNVRC